MPERTKILKPNDVGEWGMLIENDAGHISPDDDRNRPFIDEVSKLSEGKKITEEPLILYVVLQKHGVENKNGRIYPKDVLQREVERYKENINAGNAVGECVPAGTEIYTTKEGWKPIEGVQENEDILTLDVNNNKLENQKVQRTTKKWYNDKMVHIWNDSKLDMMVTKNHKKVLWNRNDDPYIVRAEDLYYNIKNGDSKTSHSYIKNGGDWNGHTPESIKIGNKEIDPVLWAKFLGIFISEGHTSGSKTGDNQLNNVVITQKKEGHKGSIMNLLNEIGFNYRLSDNRQFIITDADLWDHLSPLGDSHNKFIPEYAKNWNTELLNVLLEWLLMGDGWNRKNEKGGLMREYYTTSDKLKDDVFDIMMKCGNGASSYKRIQKDREIEGRTILEENSKDLNVIHEKTSKGIYLDNRFTNAEMVDFNDYVYCVTVPNGTWLMRYNGKVCWTHNSDHPESSIVTINKIAHRITETWWESKTLMGKMEIITTPGFNQYGIASCEGDIIANLLRRGIKIGVSSRGVGSLEEVGGKKLVQDDFELICWDAVISPSTPGSWADFSKEGLKPYMENDNSRTTKDKLNELNEKLDRFLIN